MVKIKCCIEHCKENSEIVFGNLNFCKNHFFKINQIPSIKEKDRIIKRIMKKNFRVGQKQKRQILKEERERILESINKMPTYQIVPKYEGINFVMKEKVNTIIQKKR